ncbi:MAG: caspase, partial [Cyanobacteria bacterium J06629_19]
VLPQLSKIKIDKPLDLAKTYKAVVISSPLPPLQVFLEGEEASVEALKHAIATTGSNGQPSLYVQSVDQLAGADLKIIATEQRYQITSVTDDRPLVTATSGESRISKTVQNLEHIARWRAISDLTSPPSSQIQGDIGLKIYTGTEPSHEAATEITDPCVRLSYTYSDRHHTWHQPLFRIKLSNNSSKTLYCALLYLNQQYKVDVIKPDGVNSLMRLLPGQELWFANGAALNGEVTDALWEQGITETQDLLKLIACTEEFDPSLMTLKALGQPMATIGSRDLGNTKGLNRLMARITAREIEQQITRDIGLAQPPQLYIDWTTTQAAFTFVRPQLFTPVNSTRPITINDTLTAAPHDQLSANIHLTTVTQSTRDLGSHILPSLLQATTETFQFSQSRASDPGLSTLELSNVQNPDTVTTENPLRLATDIPLAAHEYILPIAYDGEFYLPLGYGKTEAGKTQIVIERLTEPISEGNRSVTGSIRIFFQKVVSKKLGERLSQKVGLHFDYPLLSSATLSYPSSAKKKTGITYVQDVDQVKAEVTKAQNIVLYIHGIFGDTESMLPSLDTAVATLGDKATPIGKIYDLVLAFDYENLNTSIDQNARLLKSRLEAIGLGEGHGKTLHIIAHSMGGLVSRWFIEQEGGNKIVDHLIMLGTPNNGSPWPQVQAGITTAVSFAINGLSLVAAPLKILEGLLSRIETVDVSLDQMQPGSDFLAEIASAPDPNVPYTLVVGNTSLIPKNEAAGLKQRLVQRLWKTAELPFFNQPNDIAVSVDSIVAIPAGRSPEPKHIPTACNHLEYFINPHGLASLTAAVIGTGVDPNSLRSEPTEPTDEIEIKQTETKTSSRPPQKGRAAHWVGLVALLSIGAIAISLFTQHSKPEPTPINPITQPE